MGAYEGFEVPYGVLGEPMGSYGGFGVPHGHQIDPLTDTGKLL